MMGILLTLWLGACLYALVTRFLFSGSRHLDPRADHNW